MERGTPQVGPARVAPNGAPQSRWPGQLWAGAATPRWGQGFGFRSSDFGEALSISRRRSENANPWPRARHPV